MAIISQARLSDVNELVRFDAEYYKPEFLSNKRLLKNCQKVVRFGEIIELITNGATPYMSDYTKGEIRFLTAENIGELAIYDEPKKYITRSGHQMLKRSALKEGDLLITIKGRVGNCAIVEELKEETNINQDIARIVLKRGIDPYFVAVFFECKYGQFQVKQRASGMINPFIGLNNLVEFKIPIFAKDFQNRIRKLIIESNNKRKKSESKYKKAESLLLKELGITKLNLLSKKGYESKFSLVKETIRFDAEYYQPKYEQIIKILNNSGFEIRRLKEVVTISNKKIDPLKTLTKRFRYIPIAKIDISGDINGYDEFFGWQAPSRARMLVKKGDVLVSSLSGSLDKIALVPQELDNSLATTGTFVIRSNLFYSEFLFLLFRTPIIKLQLEQKTSGAIMSAVPRSTFGDLLIPVIPKTKQERIVSFIKEFFDLRKEAKQLVEQAKREVEKKIESN